MRDFVQDAEKRIVGDESLPTPGVSRYDRRPALDVVRELSVVEPVRTVWAIGVGYVCIGAAVAGATLVGHWLAYLIAIIIIGLRQHAFSLLMHDGSHWRLFRSRRLNDIVSNLFLAFPLGVTTNVYRQFHFAHHQHTLTERDPEQQLHYRPDPTMRWPKSRREMLAWFLKDLTGLHILIALRYSHHFLVFPRLLKPAAKGGLQESERYWFLGFALVVAVVLTLFDAWTHFFLLWLFPLFTVFWAISRLRILSEHTCAPNTHELTATRSTVSTILDRMLVHHVHFNYHLEHHLFPSVPHYNLPKLHERLMKDAEFRDKALVTHGYFSFAHGVLGAVTYPSSSPAL